MSQETDLKPIWILGVTSTPLPISLESAIGKNLAELITDPTGKRRGTEHLCYEHKGEQINRYILFELDTNDKAAYDEVLKAYSDLNVPVLVHVTGRGAHFFGDRRPKHIQEILTDRLKHLRLDECSYSTLRVNRKSETEIYQAAQWYGPPERPKWCQSLQYFLNRYAYYKAGHDFEDNIKKVGLRKYFAITMYALCPLCKDGLPRTPENKAKHYKEVHGIEVKI